MAGKQQNLKEKKQLFLKQDFIFLLKYFKQPFLHF